MTAHPVLVEVVRGPLIESVHRGSVVVADAEGVLQLAFGDIDSPVYPRSALKPLQAVPLVASGAAAAFGVTPPELALACASHSSEPMHTDAVAAWLARIGAQESDLVCGPHPSRFEPVAEAMIRAGAKPTRIFNNCSGKHTGFLTLATHLGASFSGYATPSHAVQAAVLAALGRFCDVDSDTLPRGVDGCAAPNFALPLRALATGFARLGDPSGMSVADQAAAHAIVAAMRAHPELVAGTGRACTALIQAVRFGGVVKTGAEGVYAGALPERGLGFALKIDDGAGRAAETAAAAVLARLGALDRDSETAQRFLAAPVFNTRGERTGSIRPLGPLAA